MRRSRNWMAAAVTLLLVVGGGSAALALGGAEKPTAELPVPQAAAVVPASVPVAYVTTGLNFPDALGGGPAAAMHDGPILLVRTDSIPAATATELVRLNPEKIVILGGTGVVSPAVATALAAYTAGTVERLSGVDRYETAAAVSQANFPAPQIAVFKSRSTATTAIDSCVAYSGLEVTIDTPVSGTVVVHANVQVDVNHVAGTVSEVNVIIGTSPTDCSADWGYDTFVFVDSVVPTQRMLPTVPVSQVLEVGPGVHSFYITGYKTSGAGTYAFFYAGMDAVFYPDP